MSTSKYTEPTEEITPLEVERPASAIPFRNKMLMIGAPALVAAIVFILGVVLYYA